MKTNQISVSIRAKSYEVTATILTKHGDKLESVLQKISAKTGQHPLRDLMDQVDAYYDGDNSVWFDRPRYNEDEQLVCTVFANQYEHIEPAVSALDDIVTNWIKEYKINNIV